MAWKIVHNNWPHYKEAKTSGECPIFHKEATVTGGYYGKMTAKTDQIPTYTLSGYSCTLPAGKGGLCSWASQCFLMPEKYL